MLDTKKISIIIPTINRYVDLKNTIKDLQKQSIQEFEIIIIDQTPKEMAENLSSIDSRISYQWSAVKSASAARNIGLVKAQGDVVLFLDDDVIISDQLFLNWHLNYYKVQSCSGVFGAVLDLKNPVFRDNRHKFSYWKENGWLFFPTNVNKPSRVRNGGAGNLSVRREWAINIGGMNEQYIKGAHREESDFCLRYTNKYGLLNYAPEACLIHIGNQEGGIRSWNQNRALKAQHNFTGAIYFIFQSVSLKYWPLHFALTIRYFFYRRELIRNPKLFFISVLRFIKGSFRAIKMRIEGPKLLNNEDLH